jgi:hypothetical protein
VLELERFNFGAPRVREVYALLIDGRNAVRDALVRYEGPASRKLVAIMRWLSESLTLPREHSFRHLGEHVYEFKEHMIPLRLFCFMHRGRIVVCTHITKKPGKKQLRNEIEKVKQLRARCFREGVLSD